MEIIVLAPLLFPGAVISADHMQRWGNTIREALGADTRIHIVTKLNNAPPVGGAMGVEIYHHAGKTRSDLIRNHLEHVSWDMAFRLPLDQAITADTLREMKGLLDKHPESLVFTDYTPDGILTCDGFTKALYDKTSGLDWGRFGDGRLENYKKDVEYYHAVSIPREIKCLAVGKDKEEIEKIVDIRVWFNPVKIKNRYTYYSKEFDFMLDDALLVPRNKVFKDKRVLEVACWEGALGSQALDAGAASVHFTDSPLHSLDWRLPFPKSLLGTPAYDRTVGENIGSLPFVLAHRDPEKVSFSRASVYELERDLNGQRYDVTIFGGVLYHLYDPMLAIQQVCKVTDETVILGTWILQGREPLAYLQEPHETDRGDSTTWFFMSYSMIKLLFAHNGFDRGTMLGGQHPFSGDHKAPPVYRYMMFQRTSPASV